MPISLGIGTAITRGGGTAWSPLSVSGLQFWVDASDATTLYTDSTLTTLAVSDGDVVGGWKDKSGNSRDALQTDGTKKPLLKLAIQNGRNVVRADGVDDFLSGSFLTTSASWSIFASCKVITNNYFGMLFTGSFGEIRLNADSSIMQMSSNYIVTDTTTCVGTPAQFSFINGSPFSLRRNQSETATSPTLAHSYQGNYSIGQRIGGLYNLNSDIYEIILYNSVLSNSDILLVEAYLKAKWGAP